MSVQNRADISLASEIPTIMHFASLADEVPMWPSKERDKYLSTIWQQESLLSGAVYSMCSKISALDFKLTGPKRIVNKYTNILQSCDFGNGWVKFIFKLVQDILTQDSGCAIEILRPPGSPSTSAAAGIAHIDISKCELTGDPEYPLLYRDSSGLTHRLTWYEAISLVDMPSPREEHRGMGYCAVSRVLRMSALLRDVARFKREKLGGKRVPGVIFASGVRSKEVESAIGRSMGGDIVYNGRTLYTGPAIVSSHDPTARVDAKLVELAGLPDGYDEDTIYKWYIITLALGFGTDYSDLAPLPGGNLGTASQVESMASRARGKGPGVILQQIEYAFNHFILPSNLEFQFESTDEAAQSNRNKLSYERARERSLRLSAGEITVRQALELAVQNGDAPETFLATYDNVDSPELEQEEDQEEIVERIVKRQKK